MQANPKTRGKTFERYERYKAATTFNEAVELGATWADLVWALDSRLPSRPWTGLSRNLSSAHERKARLWGSDQGAYEE